MDFAMQNAGETRWKVSILTRLAAVLAYTIPLIGGAISSLLLIRAFQALRTSETAGIVTLMTAVKQAAMPAAFSVYPAIFLGFIVIILIVVRMVIETETASPPIWFFALCGLLCLIPAAIFWRAEWMTIEAVSPGSAASANGLAGVGAQISNLLVISVISAPVIFLVLVAAFAVPFKSRSKSNWGALAGASAVEILLIAAAVAIPFLIGEPHRKKELVEVPSNVKYADEDADIQKETSIILILASDNKIYVERKPASTDEKTENPMTREELPGKLKALMEAKTPDKRIVYLKADVNAPYETVVQLFDLIRKNDIDKVGLVIYAEKNAGNPYQIYPKRFEVKLPVEMRGPQAPLKPNPLTLVAILKKDGTIALNNEPMGTLSDPDNLTAKLSNVFKERENIGVFREGTNEIEKTVFLQVAKSSKYGDLIKLVEAVKLSGAEPIGIQIDNLNP